jgi:predicted DNA-binding transcriptional regulator AlpA
MEVATQKDVLDIRDLADLLGYSVRWIQQRLKERRFQIAPLEGLGRKRRWSRAAVEQYLAGRRR